MGSFFSLQGTKFHTVPEAFSIHIISLFNHFYSAVVQGNPHFPICSIIWRTLTFPDQPKVLVSFLKMKTYLCKSINPNLTHSVLLVCVFVLLGTGKMVVFIFGSKLAENHIIIEALDFWSPLIMSHYNLWPYKEG